MTNILSTKSIKEIIENQNFNRFVQCVNNQKGYKWDINNLDIKTSTPKSNDHYSVEMKLFINDTNIGVLGELMRYGRYISLNDEYTIVNNNNREIMIKEFQFNQKIKESCL